MVVFRSMNGFHRGFSTAGVAHSTRMILDHFWVPSQPATSSISVVLWMIFICSCSSRCREEQQKSTYRGSKEERIERKRTGLLTVQLDLMFCLNLHKCKYLTAVLVLFLFPFRSSICLHSIKFLPSSLLFFHSTSEKLQLFWQGLKGNNTSEWECCFLLRLYKSLSFY